MYNNKYFSQQFKATMCPTMHWRGNSEASNGIATWKYKTADQEEETTVHLIDAIK